MRVSKTIRKLNVRGDYVAGDKAGRDIIKVTGKGIVIGNDNKVITSINKGLAKGELRELGNTFALLLGEILQNHAISQKVKNHATRAVQDAEDEAADKDPDPKMIVDTLGRTKEAIEASGQVYDRAKGWGKRLAEVANILTKVIPAAAPLISSLVTDSAT